MSRTLELLLNDSRSIPQISMDSRIPFHWVRQFAQGVIRNPSVNRVQALYEFLTGTKLDV
jgi:hypothetical protein